jgi:hypothetical protein
MWYFQPCHHQQCLFSLITSSWCIRQQQTGSKVQPPDWITSSHHRSIEDFWHLSESKCSLGRNTDPLLVTSLFKMMIRSVEWLLFTPLPWQTLPMCGPKYCTINIGPNPVGLYFHARAQQFHAHQSNLVINMAMSSTLTESPPCWKAHHSFERHGLFS